MEVTIKRPIDCSYSEITSFVDLVKEGGEVSTAGLVDRVRSAQALCFIQDKAFVAVGAIKKPNVNYKARVFSKAGAKNDNNYKYELGWLYVTSSARGNGYGAALMKAIKGALPDGGCFATTRKNNTAMHHLLEKFGFKIIGRPYKSENGNYNLTLYATS